MKEVDAHADATLAWALYEPMVQMAVKNESHWGLEPNPYARASTRIYSNAAHAPRPPSLIERRTLDDGEDRTLPTTAAVRIVSAIKGHGPQPTAIQRRQIRQEIETKMPALLLARAPREAGGPWFERTSWFGGLPRLGGLPWQRTPNTNVPMSFLAQIDLADLIPGSGRVLRCRR